MTWRTVGTVSATPLSSEQVVGAVRVPTFGGIEVRVQLTSPSPGFKFAYGLLSFVSPLGRELGTIRVWPDRLATDYRLGAGMSCFEGNGNLVFDARSYNLRWVKAGYPFSVTVSVDEATNLPQDRHTAPGFVNPVGRFLQFVSTGTSGRIQF